MEWAGWGVASPCTRRADLWKAHNRGALEDRAWILSAEWGQQHSAKLFINEAAVYPHRKPLPSFLPLAFCFLHLGLWLECPGRHGDGKGTLRSHCCAPRKGSRVGCSRGSDPKPSLISDWAVDPEATLSRSLGLCVLLSKMQSPLRSPPGLVYQAKALEVKSGSDSGFWEDSTLPLRVWGRAAHLLHLGPRMADLWFYKGVTLPWVGSWEITATKEK